MQWILVIFILPYPPPAPPIATHTFLPTRLLKYVWKPIKSSWCCPNNLEWVPSPGICSTYLSGVIALKKTDFLSHSPSNFQITVTPQLGVGRYAHVLLTCLNFVWIMHLSGFVLCIFVSTARSLYVRLLCCISKILFPYSYSQPLALAIFRPLIP